MDDFISKQKKQSPPKPSNATEKQKKMAAELGLDEDFAITDDEEDILDDFISKQKKPKSSKCAVTEKQRKIASDLGLDDDLDIEDLIGEIEADDEAEADKSFDWGSDNEADKGGAVEAVNDSEVEKMAGNKIGDHERKKQQQETAAVKNDFSLFSSSLHAKKSFAKPASLPPLRGKPGSLPPLQGIRKPKF